MFLTAADFNIIPFNLPNLDKVGSAFQTYVDRAEREVLISLLGVDMYNAFVAGLEEDYPEDKWQQLRDGEDYSYRDKTYNWVGMKELLRPYVYAMWIRDDFKRFSGIGVVVKKGENAKVVNPSGTISDAYNEFSAMAGSRFDYQNTLFGFLSVGDYDFEVCPSFWHEPLRMNKFNI